MARKLRGLHAWNSFPELTNALLQLAHAPTGIPEQSMHVIERLFMTEQALTLM